MGNVLLSLVLSFSFWKLRWWYGGDAKLFVVYSFFLSSLKHAPLQILVNTFLPLCFYFVLCQVKHISRKDFFFSAMGVFSLSWLSGFITHDPILQMALIAGATPLFMQVPRILFIQGGIAFARPFFDASLFTKQFWVFFFFWTFFFIGMRQIVQQKDHTRHMPFAPALFAGTVITILLSGNIFDFVISFI